MVEIPKAKKAVASHGMGDLHLLGAGKVPAVVVKKNGSDAAVEENLLSVDDIEHLL